MNDRTLRLSLTAIAASAGIATFCAISAFVMVMLLVNRTDNQETAAQAQISPAQSTHQPLLPDPNPTNPRPLIPHPESLSVTPIHNGDRALWQRSRLEILRLMRYR